MRASIVLLLVSAGLVLGQDGFGDAFKEIFRVKLTETLTTLQLSPGRAGEVRNYLKPDRSDPTMFFLIGAEVRDLQITLKLPDDSLVRRDTAAGKNIQWEEAKDTAGSGFDFYGCRDRDVPHWTTISLPNNFAAGEYILELQSAKATKVCVAHWTPILGREGLDYESVGNSVSTDHQFYQLGETVTISVPVKDDAGRPVRNATVDAVIEYQKLDGILVAQGEAGRVRLLDREGRGIYTATFRPAKPSYYGIVATIAGRKQREVGSFEVKPFHLRLLTGSVTNGDGFAQAVMRFEVMTPGRYKVDATVKDSKGKLTWEAVLADFPAGQHAARWNISQEHAEVEGVQGPYTLTEIHVVRMDPSQEYGSELAGWWLNQGGGWKSK